MFTWILGFLVFTIVWGFFGLLPGVGGGEAPLARMVFFILAALFALSMIAGLVEGERLTHRHHHP